MIKRTLHPEIRVIDATERLVRFVASDESIDSYGEIIRAKGWRFDRFKRNSPFLADHNYEVASMIGAVVDFGVEGKRLVEVCQYAKDMPETSVAEIAWKLTEGGFLKAVSVGFIPEPGSIVRGGSGEFARQLSELGLTDDGRVSRIYTQQQQIELSAVVIGANENALAAAYEAKAITRSEVEFLSSLDCHSRVNGPQKRGQKFLDEFERLVKTTGKRPPRRAVVKSDGRRVIASLPGYLKKSGAHF